MADDDAPRTQPLFARGRERVAADVTATEPATPLANTTPGRPSSEHDKPPSTISRFEVKSKLGEGGMGVVLLASDPLLGRRVALKVLHQRDGTTDTDAAKRRLLREAQGMAQLTHDNVIVVHEVGTHEDQVYLAMEYVDGMTLGRWQAGRPWREIVQQYLRAGRGLLAAHEAGLVHRDFKPDNVLVGHDGRLRVTDFGLVASIDDAAVSSPEVRSTELAVSLTRTGSIMGTPRYMAPEQHLADHVDARADQFAFCVALYEALYGQAPFAGTDYIEIAKHVIAGEVRTPTSTEIPDAIRTAILRGLSRDREDRFPALSELLSALTAGLAANVTHPARRRRWPIIAGATLVVAGGALVIGLGREGAETPPDPPAAPNEVAATVAEASRELARAQAELDELRTRLTDRHPQVIAAQNRVTEAMRRLGGAGPGSGSSAPDPDRPWARGVSRAEQDRALALFRTANDALRDGRDEEARIGYEAALQQWNHPAIHYNLALALIALGRHQDMLEHVDGALTYPEALDRDKVETARRYRSLALGQTMRDAREAFDRGVIAFETKTYKDAAAAFEQANARRATPALSFDRAASLHALASSTGDPRDRANAVTAYKLYVAVEPDPDRRQAAVDAIHALERNEHRAISLRSVIAVESEPAGAMVSIDDATTPVGKTPWIGSFEGAHTLRIEIAGYPVATRHVNADKPRWYTVITAFDKGVP